MSLVSTMVIDKDTYLKICLRLRMLLVKKYLSGMKSGCSMQCTYSKYNANAKTMFHIAIRCRY